MRKNLSRYKHLLVKDYKNKGMTIPRVVAITSLPLNVYANVALIDHSWQGWLTKLVLDLFFLGFYLRNFHKDPCFDTIILLLHMLIFIPVHFFGFIAWAGLI